MTTEIVDVLENGILTLGFNRPSHKNAIMEAMYTRLAEVFNDANERDDVRVVVLHGSETAF
ncbi:enoyl-CoA hydratase-related protein [Paraburkholderia phytofirmans]|uniref:Enoyl-CoA hydratase n=1 Tax=Paraburkholderia phytofirmans OLGA172 TaxID=1417228 RepID=A0A161HPW9_9BURK|nr:enoyl-CoA hydratase-related protein [Paraburkholderia phytofirmans]ANB75747.1 hypothetical protein AYM40_25880 [Paraburkholderia phytofirmans OLGA172]